jgi:hypothetical protein
MADKFLFLIQENTVPWLLILCVRIDARHDINQIGTKKSKPRRGYR